MQHVDGRGIQKRGNEGGDEHRPGDEGHHPPERVEPRRGVAQPAHADGGDEGLAAIGEEKGQHQGNGPVGRQLARQMRRECGEQIDPPTPPL